MSAAPKHLENTIRVILKNGRRLLHHAEFLEYSEPPTSAHYLTQIAQEEFAKAFLFALCARGIIPWHRILLRASTDHKCKQLLCIVLDYLGPDVDEFLDRCDAVVLRNEIPSFPRDVADAINILRHEKIGRWISNTWCWAEDPKYDHDALSVARGDIDGQKQDSLYVRLWKDGSVASRPEAFSITRPRLVDDMEKARRFATVVEQLLDNDGFVALDWSKVEDAFRAVFTDLSTDNKGDSRKLERSAIKSEDTTL